MQFIIIGIFVSFFMINICSIVLAHYMIHVKSGKTRWELLLWTFLSKLFFYEAPMFLCVILRVYKTEKSGVTWVHSEDCVPSTDLQPVSISASFLMFLQFLSPLKVSMHLHFCKIWMVVGWKSQNQPQLDIRYLSELWVQSWCDCILWTCDK